MLAQECLDPAFGLVQAKGDLWESDDGRRTGLFGIWIWLNTPRRNWWSRESLVWPWATEICTITRSDSVPPMPSKVGRRL